jgi:hypothetical protein
MQLFSQPRDNTNSSSWASLTGIHLIEEKKYYFAIGGEKSRVVPLRSESQVKIVQGILVILVILEYLHKLCFPPAFLL